MGIDPTQINLSFTGHSLGGGLAQYMGALTGLQTTTFNAVGMASQMSSLFNNINTQGFNITNYIVNGDFVSTTFNEVGQDLYATIPTVDSSNPLLNSYDEHMIPLLPNLIDTTQDSQGFTLNAFTSTTPNAASTALFNASQALQNAEVAPATPYQVSLKQQNSSFFLQAA